MSLFFPELFPTQRIVPGPFRVVPGSLSVSRTFGDLKAKKPKYGGMPNLVIAEPEIRTIKLSPELDWILLGCDGIFDKMSNEKVAQVVWETAKQEALSRLNSIHDIVSCCSEAVLKEAMKCLSIDNITAILVVFQGFQDFLSRVQQSSIVNQRKASAGLFSSKKPSRIQKDSLQLKWKTPVLKKKGENGAKIKMGDLEASSKYSK